MKKGKLPPKERVKNGSQHNLDRKGKPRELATPSPDNYRDGNEKR